MVLKLVITLFNVTFTLFKAIADKSPWRR